MQEYYNKVLEFFEGDKEKTDIWFESPNPLLGYHSPNLMIRIGREDKVKKFIDNALDENQLP